jgi:phage-related minor tail protein
MADDTAALVVSLEARFDKFEKAMKDVAKVVEQQTKVIEQSFDKMTSAISEKLGHIQGALINKLGLAGELLKAIGPAGAVAAASIGVVVVALGIVADATLKFGEAMKKLRDLSQVTGLSAETLQALKKAADDIGADFDNITPAITVFIRNWELLKKGAGSLREELLQLNPTLEKQLAAARDEQEAIQLLAQAFKGLTAAQAQLLGRAAFARVGGSDTIRLFQKGFDLDALKESLRAYNKLIQQELVDSTAENFDKLLNNYKKLLNTVPALIGRLFGPTLIDQANQGLKNLRELIDDWIAGVERGGGSKPLRITVNAKPQLEAPREIPLGERAATSRERIGFLGESATAFEKLTDAMLQNEASAKRLGIAGTDLARVQKFVTQASEEQGLQVRATLGIASEQEIKALKLMEIDKKRAQGVIDDAERERAAIIAVKESREQYEQTVVRASKLPGLSRLGLDAQNFAKQFDQFATTSLNTFTDSMADAITGTKSLSDAFKDMTNSILKDLARMVIRQGVIAPLLGAFGLTGKMAGGPVEGGVPYIVGERGPELFIPTGAGSIVPNSKLAQAGGVSVVGPTTNIMIEGSADRTTIAAMKEMLAQRDRRFVADVARASGELRRRSVMA